MTERRGDGERRALEQDGYVLHSTEALVWPSDAVAMGRGRAEVLPNLSEWTKRADFEIDAGFREANSRIIESVGVGLERSAKRPSVFRVSFESGVLGEVRVLGGSGSVERDEQNPSVVYAEIDWGTECLVSTGQARIFFATEENRVLLELWAEPLSVPALAGLDAGQVHAWVRELEDGWLSETLRQRLESGTPWNVACAAGIYRRLKRPKSDEETRAIVQEIVSTGSSPLDRQVDGWAKTWTEDQIRTVSDLALVEVDLLRMDIDEFVDEDPPTRQSPTWPRWMRLRHRRDDLEGIRVLLLGIRRNEALDSALEELDAAGKDLIAGLPDEAHELDERLERVHSADGQAWWAAPWVFDSDFEEDLE